MHTLNIAWKSGVVHCIEATESDCVRAMPELSANPAVARVWMEVARG